LPSFNAEIPNDIIKQVEDLEKNTEKMLGEMTEAGAKVVLQNIKAALPSSFYGSDIIKCLKITKVYKTPSDDGVNTKVAFYGYFTDKDGRKKPAPLVANVYEYGRSSSRFPKKPFLRRSFKKDQIEKAMKAIQDKYIPKG
jgi:hypothetical protein